MNTLTKDNMTPEQEKAFAAIPHCNHYPSASFVEGWNSRQPEIDALAAERDALRNCPRHCLAMCNIVEQEKSVANLQSENLDLRAERNAAEANATALQAKYTQEKIDRLSLQARKAELQTKVAELQAIVDRLPKTADGVPISCNTIVWFAGSAGAIKTSMDAAGFCPATIDPYHNCYFTRQAAEAAMGGGK